MRIQIIMRTMVCGLLFATLFSPPAKAAGIAVAATTPVIANVQNVGNIWKADIPTRILFPSDSYSEKLEFPMTGLLPYSELADRALGVDVEFQIWTDSGVKLESTTIYSFSWNPVGPNTMVSMYLRSSDKSFYGTHTMIISTTYKTSTTGLLSKYLADEKRLKFTIEKALSEKAPDAPKITSTSDGNVATINFNPVTANPEVTKYQLTVSSLLRPGLPPTSSFNYGQRVIVMESVNPKFELTKKELQLYFNSQYANLDTTYILVRVEAVNAVGNSDTSNGIYFEPNNFGLSSFSSARNWSPSGQFKTGVVDSYQSCQEINYDTEVLLTQADEYNSKVAQFKRQYGKVLKKFVFTDSVYPLKPIECTDSISNSDNELRKLVVEAAQEELANLESQYEKTSSEYRTITCVKGKLIRKVSGKSPKCAVGFRKK